VAHLAPVPVACAACDLPAVPPFDEGPPGSLTVVVASRLQCDPGFLAVFIDYRTPKG
jgi:hypothetical protein